jgi:uncharacterized protein YecE (DUF72 family)
MPPASRRAFCLYTAISHPKLLMTLYTGCSGFHYREWKGLFYPDDLPQKSWLSYYATRFDTLELNNTFYRFPTEASLAKWHRDTPEGFHFVVKAPKLFTHLKKLQGVDAELAEFYRITTAALGEKLTCLLFQFPASVHYSQAFLETILETCKGEALHAFEFRHESWWSPAIWEALQAAGHVFCNVSLPGMPDFFVPDAQHQYLRFHGKPVLYKSGYGADGLAPWLAHIQAARLGKVFALFNNTWYGEAIKDAELWRESLTK